jgi:elongation factor Ts
MEITPEQVRTLRDKTGAGIMECKEALNASGGNVDAAVDFLRKKGLKTAEKKAGRATANGLIGHYIHSNGRIGVIVEVNCETDFVARNEEFIQLVKDIAMHIAATRPMAVSRSEIKPETIERERAIYVEQVKALGKPEAAVPKIVEGKFDKFFAENCLLEQPFVKDETKTIEALIKSKIAKIGENIQIKRFARFEIGLD